MVKIRIKNKEIESKEYTPYEKEPKFNTFYYYCRNVIKINGKTYHGNICGDKDFIDTIRYLDDRAEHFKNQHKECRDHPDVCIGIIKGG